MRRSMSIFGKKWAAIFYNHSDTLATKANIQDSAKGQSSVSSDEFLVVVHLAVGGIFSAFHRPRAADPIGRDHKYKSRCAHFVAFERLSEGNIYKRIATNPQVSR